MKRKSVAGCLLGLVLLIGSAWGMTVELQWDANTETDLAGYRAYVKDMSAGAGFVVWSTVHRQTTVRLANLSSSRKYVFAVTAFNDSGQESSFSNRVYVGVPVKQMKIKRLRGSVR